ncbi:MAG: multicopper oxidase family protein [Myxococcota bacterium]
MRARVLNASNTAYLWLESSDPSSLELRAVAGDQGFDGGPREAPVLVGPGDRVELELGVRSAASLRTRRWSLNGGEVPYAPAVELVRFQVDTTGDLSSSPDWPFSGALPTPDVARTDVLWALMGSDRSGRWTINAEVFPNITPETLPLGRPAIVEVRNMSPTEHPFHLHGFVFELLSRNGVAPPFRTIEDTINVRIRERLRLRVTPERPGDWMAHCHILPHADGGMMTVLRVPPQP